MPEAFRQQAPPPPQPDPNAEKLAFDHHPAWGLIGVTLGVLVILAAGYYEQRTLQQRPFADALYAFGKVPEWVEPIPIQSRRLPRNAFPSVYDALDEMRNSAQGQAREDIETLIQSTGVMDTERIIQVPFTQELLQSALLTGRLPEPGKPELLAGANARLNEFKIDGQTFRVVGRLRRAASPFHFAYLIPKHEAWLPIFEEHPAAETGWFDLQGRIGLRQSADPRKDIETYNLEAIEVPTDPRITAATISGLMLVALFGAMAHLSVFRVLMPLRCGPLRPAFRVVLTRPRVVILMHLLLFGSFFAMTLAATRMPVPNMWLLSFIRHTFDHGELQHVGQAYASGNIPMAAWATFFNNYIIQTLILTFAISLVIPMIGILKTLLSFLMVGFGMSPIWAGAAMGYSYHSITLTLELEAYIIACVIVFHFWAHLAMTLIKGQFRRRLKESLQALASGLLLTALMLATAAAYEAITLIAAAQ